MYLYIFCIICILSIISSYVKAEHYIIYSKTGVELNTNIFDKILERNIEKKKKAKKAKEKEKAKDSSTKWKELRKNIDEHTSIMFKLRSAEKYKQDNLVNNTINIIKQKFNDNICKRYVQFYNFNVDAKMISHRNAELKPLIDTNTGIFSETLNECVHVDPNFTNKFECPKSIRCPNRRKSVNVKHKLKNYEHVCEYSCV